VLSKVLGEDICAIQVSFICRWRSSVFLFLLPFGLPARFWNLYQQGNPFDTHREQGNPPEHLTLRWWQASHAERNFLVCCTQYGGWEISDILIEMLMEERLNHSDGYIVDL
jgi:hypothetical protein